MDHPFFGQALHAGLHHMAACVKSGQIIKPDAFGQNFEAIFSEHARHLPPQAKPRFQPEARRIIAGYWRELYQIARATDSCWFKPQYNGHKFDLILRNGKVYEAVEVVSHRFMLGRTFTQRIREVKSSLRRGCPLLAAAYGNTVVARIYTIRNDVEQRHEPVWIRVAF